MTTGRRRKYTTQDAALRSRSIMMTKYFIRSAANLEPRFCPACDRWHLVFPT